VFAESLWWDALDRLLTIATCTAPIADVYLTQLAQVELPLLLAAQFAELEPCANLGPPAVRALAAQLEQHVDETGLPLPAIRRSFLPLLASWGRSLEIARQARRQGEVLGAARSRWILAIEQAVRSLRADGTCVFDAPQTEGHRTDWLLTLARSTGRKRLRRVVGVVLGHKRRLPKRVPPLAMHSSKAASAWMRSAWRPGSAQLAVAYDGATLHVEVGVKRNVLISGACTPEVMVDGQLRFPTSRWTENCWQSTRHFDYLELDLEFPGVELERQILFSRTDRWMLVADALLAQEAGELAVRSPLPLWPGVEYVPAGETHEGRLMIGKQTVARCLPLALPEWRSEPAPGILASAEAGLALQHRQASTTRLFAPLLIDFDQRRLSQPYTWRRLTIGEQRRQAPPDAAAGYRVQLGRQQWLIYRSLRQGPARTALGHQTFRQFVVGRVNRKGKIEPLLELE
jgi:hypothetical protein